VKLDCIKQRTGSRWFNTAGKSVGASTGPGTIARAQRDAVALRVADRLHGGGVPPGLFTA
jgi:hypothetical protein